jgi:chromosomal replication initiator protein
VRVDSNKLCIESHALEPVKTLNPACCRVKDFYNFLQFYLKNCEHSISFYHFVGFPERTILGHFHFSGGSLNFQSLWTQVKSNILAKNTQNHPLVHWFEPAKLMSCDTQDGLTIMKVSLPSLLHQYWVQQNLLETITAEVTVYFNQPFHIEFVIVKEEPLPPEEYPLFQALGAHPASGVETNPEAILANNPNITVDHQVGSQAQSSRASQINTTIREALNSEYTFSTFVVGRNTEFAHAVSFSIANSPGADNYNPLFICGPTGMGKTHLLHAVGNHVKSKFPQMRICYCSAERFLNEWISSIRRSEAHKFRQKYREQSDILLMDDIQILGRGEAVQEEFFHTLNDFFEKGRQVILASDRMPKDIAGLEDRIRTRFEWGLIADIQMPDIETRVAILRYKAERRGIRLPNDVINFIARISKTSIRQLEGNLNKIKMFAELQGLPITIELAKKVLASHDETRIITVEDVTKITAEHFQLRPLDIKAKSRIQPVVKARQIAMYMINKHLDKSLVEIGRVFGGKDHSTVINALRRVDSQLTADPDFKKDFMEIENKIHNITGV